MIEKVVKKCRLSEHDEVKSNLAYWLSKPPAERVAAVEFLRELANEGAGRLQRVARVVQRPRG